jgi:hypothetical protein
MGRFTQLLVPLHGEAKEKPLVAFDCETVGKQNRFVLGVISTDRGEERFTDPQAMLDRLTDETNLPNHVFATQLGFDAFVLFQATAGDRRMPKDFSSFDNGSKLIWVKRMIAESERNEAGRSKAKKRRYVTLLDSLNVFPGGVESMGDILQKVSVTYRKRGLVNLADRYNVKKLPSPGCECAPSNPDHDGCKSWLGKLSWDQMSSQQRETTFTYCALDAKVTRLFMEWFQGEIVKLGASLRMTAASTAMDLFRRRYMKQESQVIPQPHWTALVDSRLSYYGGRTEDFVKGTIGPVWDYDVASMYPSSMLEIEFPYPSPERFTRIDHPHEKCLQREGFSRVTVTVPAMDIPPLPFRQGPKLLFPTGTLLGVWTNLELRYAISQGCVVNDIEWSYFTDKTFNPFSGYVTDLYNKRLSYAYPSDCSEADCRYHVHKHLSGKCSSALATEEVIKLFLNSLYGKFAQSFLTEEESKELGVKSKKGGGTFKHLEDATEEEILFTGQNFPEYLIEGYVIDKAVPKLKAFMNPILSSYVTARARVKLHEFFMLSVKEGAKVLYTDTDSLYVTKPLSFAVEEKILGKLQVGKEWCRMTILGPKSKMLVDTKGKAHYTAKGVPGKSFLFTEGLKTKRTKPRAELFASLETEAYPTVKYSRFLRFKESMARGRLPNEIVEMSKTFDPFEFPKRRIIGKPSLKDLTRGHYETEPWEVQDGIIVKEAEA